MASPTRQLLVACLAMLLASASKPAQAASASTPTPARAAKSLPQKNPLRAADESTRRQALTEAWMTFQRSCRPCHGNMGAGDGPYAAFFPRRATDLRRPGKAIATDAVRFRRIHDGGAGLPERPWESSMPAFGDDLDERQIWGLVSLLETFGQHESGLDPGATATDVYVARCEVCHGATGKGDGPLAAELFPRPRNFVRADYRFRSTAYGEAPIDSDLMGSTARGLGTTAMGTFLTMGAQHIEDLAAHLVTYAPERFKGEPDVVPFTATPAIPAADLAARGRQVYDEAGCAECHGKAGRGNGPAAATLKNDEGQPVIATDLTRRWLAKTGSSSNDTYRTISTGLNGTPMRGYADSISGDDRWALVYYLDRFGRGRPRYPTSLFARALTDDLPLDPTAPLWSTIPLTGIPLGPQIELAPYWSQPAIDMVEISVAVSQKQIALLLTWNDRTRDVRSDDAGGTRSVVDVLARYGTWRLPDQVAVQFPVASTPDLPPPYLGSPTRAVDRWHWSADRHEGGQGVVVERATGSRQPLVTQSERTVKSAAAYEDGQWRVVLIGDLPETTPETLPIAIQVWDGASGETGNWLALSAWVPVTLH